MSLTSCQLPVASQGLMHVNGRPVAAFDPEGLIFGAGIDAEYLKLYDLRSFDRVRYYFKNCIVISV